jgi:superfamily II DNA/RNA helicase
MLDDPDLPNWPPPKSCYLLNFFMQHVRSTDDQGFKRLPKIIVYVNGKRKADALAIYALRHGFKVFSFHGDKSMNQVSVQFLLNYWKILANQHA